MECALHGLFLWSDQWNMMGTVVERAAESELDTNRSDADGATSVPSSHTVTEWSVPAVETVYRYDRVFRLGWCTRRSALEEDSTVTAELSISVPQESVSPLGRCSSTAHEVSSHVVHEASGAWRTLTRVALDLDKEGQSYVFVPYVTLMEKGDEAMLLS